MRTHLALGLFEVGARAGVRIADRFTGEVRLFYVMPVPLGQTTTEPGIFDPTDLWPEGFNFSGTLGLILIAEFHRN